MEAMDGPINFGERDKFWGLLIEGFSEPLYAMNYNAPYYKELFEKTSFFSIQKNQIKNQLEGFEINLHKIAIPELQK